MNISAINGKSFFNRIRPMHVLDEIHHKPTAEEIEEYATVLGIKEKKYYYIAEKGLTSKLPINWSPIEDKNGLIYYYNALTKMSQWEHPNDNICKIEYSDAKKSDAAEDLKSDKQDILDLLSSDNSNVKKPTNSSNLANTIIESESVQAINNLPPLAKQKNSNKYSLATSTATKSVLREASSASRKEHKPTISIDTVENELEPRWKTKTLKRITQDPSPCRRPKTAEEIFKLEPAVVLTPAADTKIKRENSGSLNRQDSTLGKIEKVTSIYDITSRYKLNDHGEGVKDSMEIFLNQKFSLEKENMRKEFEILNYKLQISLEGFIDERISSQKMTNDSIKLEIQEALMDSVKELEKTLNGNFNKSLNELKQSLISSETQNSKRIIDDSFSAITTDLVELQTEIKVLKSTMDKQRSLNIDDITFKVAMLEKEVASLKTNTTKIDIEKSDSADQERLMNIRNAFSQEQTPRFHQAVHEEEETYIGNGLGHIEDRIEKHSIWLNTFLSKYK
eukprot:NODE_91_length_21779_cov_0.171356.p4 type:complete len:507 gc:universal NODE_91_length_21779_cov_0.171356:20446-18926(-)